MADPVKPPPADDAGRQAWIAEQNRLNAERRAAEYQQRYASKPDAAPEAAAAPKKQGSWLDRADDLKNKVKNAFSEAAEGVKSGIKELVPEPGHGPTTVDTYRRQNPGAPEV